LLPQVPTAAGLTENWDIPQTEMHDEPLRSGCVWTVGKGRVFYFRPLDETYPAVKQADLTAFQKLTLDEPERVLLVFPSWVRFTISRFHIAQNKMNHRADAAH